MIYFAGQPSLLETPPAYATSNPAGKVITLRSGDKSFMVFGCGVSHIGVVRILLAIAMCISLVNFFPSSREINVFTPLFSVEPLALIYEKTTFFTRK